MDKQEQFIKSIRYLLMDWNSILTQNVCKEFGLNRNDLELWATNKTLPITPIRDMVIDYLVQYHEN